MTVPPSAAQMRRISAVTANFNGLQGLILAPASLWLFAFGTVMLLAPDATGWAMLALVAVFGAMALIMRSYRERFGRVRAGDFVVQAATAVTALTLFMFSGVAVNLLGREGSPIWPQGLQAALILAVLILLPPLMRGRAADLAISRHWQVMCGLLALAALVPVGLFTGGTHPLNTTDELGDAALVWSLAACLLIGGLLDHRILVRSLGGPPPTEER